MAIFGFDAIAGRIAGDGFAAQKKPLATAATRFPYIVYMPNKSAKKARILSSRPAYRGPAFWVTTDKVLEPTGVTVRRDIVHHTGSVVVLAVDDSQAEPKILLVRQYRHAASQYLWELCAGRIDEGENELVAAKREFREETGYSAKQWKRIFRFYASPGFVAETMAIYVARGLRPGPAHPEEDEVIVLRFFPLNAALKMVRSGTIKDAKTIIGILWLAQQDAAKS